MNTLPDKPSELLTLALADLEACEKDAAYGINMAGWHEQTGNAVCHVCLAGAVMAKSLEADPDLDIRPSDFPVIGNKFLAIDAFRGARFYQALDLLGYHLAQTDYPVGIKRIDYETNPAGFKNYIKEIITWLQTHDW